ncbi:putative transposase [Theobroma cacao]|nr:putative transposase [Theobroma cacao]
MKEKELGRLVTQAEVFDHTHKRSNGEFVDKKSKTVNERYAFAILQKFGESSTQLEFDAEA